MNIDAVNVQKSAELQMRKATESVSDARKQKEDVVQSESVDRNKVQPEELLQQIKGLTEDGSYSVQFESDDRTSSLVVKIIDRANDEVIRQVPVEEILELKSILADLRGNIIDTEG